MRAMVVRKPRPAEEGALEPADLPLPDPAPGEVRLRVAACGVCHTDLHTLEGDLPLKRFPTVPGHQVVGRVEALGAGARRFRRGERVGVAWLHAACGECPACRRGEENLCEGARFTGWDADGGYAESMVVPEAFAYRLPERFSDTEAAPLLCAGVIGFRALALSEARPGERLGLFGFGGSAHLTLQIARARGIECRVFTRSEGHRRLALELGAAWAGGSDEGPPGSLDRAVVFAPAASLVPAALERVRRGGTVAIASIHLDRPVTLDYARHLYWERTLRSVANATRRDAEGFLEEAAAIPVRVAVETAPLERAGEVLARLKAGRVAGAAVLDLSLPKD